MTNVLTQAVLEESLKLHSVSAFIFLYQIQVNDTEAVRITSYHEEIIFQGDTYTSYNVNHTAIQADIDGNITDINLKVSNVDRQTQLILEDNNGLSDNEVRVIVVHEDHLADIEPAVEEIFQVVSVSANLKVAEIKIGHTNLFDKPFPANRFLRTRCGWKYKKIGCSYQGNKPSCDKTLAGTNGCVIHGDDEEENGLPRIHPNRFRGFPGIPQGPAG